VLRKLAFPQIAPPAIFPVRTDTCASVLAGTPAGYSSRICSFPTRKPATQPPVLVPQGTVRACRSSECQPIQLSKNLHPEPVRAPSHAAQPQVAVALPRFCFFSSGGTYRFACANSPSSSASSPEIKKPGVERRVKPRLGRGFTRCSTLFYPVFVANLTWDLQWHRLALNVAKCASACGPTRKLDYAPGTSRPLSGQSGSIATFPQTSSPLPNFLALFFLSSPSL
jgi:hypothetical protein